MAKNIVICCDGTGNEFGDNNSNVVNLYSSLIIDGTRQVGYYHPGVGTMGAPTDTNRVSRQWSVVKGLAFGAGFLPNVSDAYRYLMNVYEDGDHVYLFGFSRGAYTVRALAGALHMFGLLCPGNDGLIPYVIRMYAKHSRDAGGMKHTFNVAEDFKSTFGRHCPLHFVGVWDTVSSIGWIWDPVRLPYTAQNPDMRHGRHAISIDERRCYFRNNLWGKELPGQSLKQVWFAGVHSDVGGSYAPQESGLSQITLEWMLGEAVPLGLLINPKKANCAIGHVPPGPPIAPDHNAKIHNSLTKSWWILEFLPHKYFDEIDKRPKWRIPFGARRKIPEDSVFHESVRQKLAGDKSYVPRNLAKPLPENAKIEPWIARDFEKPEGQEENAPADGQGVHEQKYAS